MITLDQARYLVDEFENERSVKFTKLMAKHGQKLDASITKTIGGRAKKGYISVNVAYVRHEFLEKVWFSWRFDQEFLSDQIVELVKKAGFEVKDGTNMWNDPIKIISWG